MKNFFDYRRIIEIVEVVFTIMVIICTNITIYARQNNENERLISEIQSFSYETFGQKRIETIDYLYSFDGSTDYVCILFENSGYAILQYQTLEVLEYSLDGSLPYASQTRKYYCGPTHYYVKINEEFKNLMTNEVLSPNDAENLMIMSKEMVKPSILNAHKNSRLSSGR